MFTRKLCPFPLNMHDKNASVVISLLEVSNILLILSETARYQLSAITNWVGYYTISHVKTKLKVSAFHQCKNYFDWTRGKECLFCVHS